MKNITLILVLLASIFTVLHIFAVVPLWIGVLLLCGAVVTQETV